MTEGSTFVAVAAALWVAIGLFLCVAMGRRGYSAFTWFVLGALLGPLAVILAVVSRRRDEKPKAAKPKAEKPKAEKPKAAKPKAAKRKAEKPKAEKPKAEKPKAEKAKAAGAPVVATVEGQVDVLVGYDGSPAAQAAPETARELLGARLGRLTVATVVPHDCSKNVERLAKSELRRVTGALEGIETRTELLHGRPAVVLGEYAAAGGYELVVVGRRGAGFSTSVLGSTATELARRSRVPVLLVGAGAPREEISAEPA